MVGRPLTAGWPMLSQHTSAPRTHPLPSDFSLPHQHAWHCCVRQNVSRGDVDQEIAKFFLKTPICRETCHAVAEDLVSGGRVVPVPIQGACSYTVYAGPDLGHIVQFRLKSHELKTERILLARQIFGSLVPDVSFERSLGEDATTAGQEPLLVYVMARVKGISHLDFILAHGDPENSQDNKAYRKTLMGDVARFFALAWSTLQKVNDHDRNRMAERFEEEMHKLLRHLPARFSSVIRATLASIPRILSLPMVLLHEDFSYCNIMVEESTCRLKGVIDWAEADIGPFGTKLHCLQSLMSKVHLKKGRIRYEDFETLESTFWDTFQSMVGELHQDTIEAIKAARVLGLLRVWGFTNQLANQAKTIPSQDDDNGRYAMMILDGLLVNPNTSFGRLKQ